MKREYAAFLIGGFLFGILFGYGLFSAIQNRPDGAGAGPSAAIPAPAGPPAPTQVADGGAPAMAQINDLKRKLQENPEDLSALLPLGDLYRQIDNWDEASQYYDRAAAAHPDNLDLQRALAYLYQDAGRCPQAVPYYQRLIEARADDPDLLTDLGVCYRSLERYEEALELFRRASGADPEHWQSVFNTVVVTGLDLGRAEDAAAAMQRLRELRPNSPDVDSLAEALAARRSGEG